MQNAGARTLFRKLWDTHVICEFADGPSLLYLDRHLVHEVSSPQAFAGLRARGLAPWRPAATLAVPDHSVPTHRDGSINNQVSTEQLSALHANAVDSRLLFIPLQDRRQGIAHVVGPELGFVLPGLTVACGDSHTSTHGAVGALAFGVGSSDVEHVLATQTLRLQRPREMRVRITGALPCGVTAKDVALALIGHVGAAGAANHAVEFCGDTVSQLSIEGRMTLCNMAVEMGARTAVVAVDERTIAYFQGKPWAPRGAAFDSAAAQWRSLCSDRAAVFDREVSIDVSSLDPHVTWGTSPSMVTSIGGRVPMLDEFEDGDARARAERAMTYMGLRQGTPMTSVQVDHVFVGSCTNARIEDLRDAARIVQGRRVASTIKRALVVPGSGTVKRQAEAEGLDRCFIEAGFEWRAPGCSMCIAMNGDELKDGERCASTSNRNFEGRQGAGGRTHLVSPCMAAAAAIAGRFVDVRTSSLAA